MTHFQLVVATLLGSIRVCLLWSLDTISYTNLVPHGRFRISRHMLKIWNLQMPEFADIRDPGHELPGFTDHADSHPSSCALNYNSESHAWHTYYVYTERNDADGSLDRQLAMAALCRLSTPLRHFLVPGRWLISWDAPREPNRIILNRRQRVPNFSEIEIEMPSLGGSQVMPKL
jgi:hypothetical protein